MIDVCGQGNVRRHVEQSDYRLGHARDHVVVNCPMHEVRICPAQRQVGEVEQQEQQDNRATPSHRATCVVRLVVLTLVGVATLAPGCPVATCQNNRCSDVEDEHDARPILKSNRTDPSEPSALPGF